MSTQSIKNPTLEQICDSLDKVLVCIADRYLLEDKFGVKTTVVAKDIFFVKHFKRLIKYRSCVEEVSEENLHKINKLIIKYK